MKLAKATGPLFVAALFLLSCDKEEEIPSFIKIPEIELITDPGNEGSNSHNIVDAWVFVDDQLLGAYGLPAEVPALHAGTHNIKIIAGIKKDGIASTRIQYPFYDTYETTVELVREQNSIVTPTVQYFDGLDLWIEDFELVGNKFVNSAQSDTTLEPVTDPAFVFEGMRSGGIFLDPGYVYFRCHTDENFVVNPGETIFLELDYRNNNRLLVGVTFEISGTPVDIPVLFINATGNNSTSTWNKIYVDLTTAFNTLGASNREFYFEVLKESGVDSAKVYIDNVKFIQSGS